MLVVNVTFTLELAANGFGRKSATIVEPEGEETETVDTPSGPMIETVIPMTLVGRVRGTDTLARIGSMLGANGMMMEAPD